MSMREPTPRKSRLALATVVVAVIVVGGGGFLLGRETTERTEVVALPPVVKPGVAPEPENSILGRSDLIELAAVAADATAAGQPARRSAAEIEGRRFELRLPFGCTGPEAADSRAPMRWRYDRDDQTLRLSVSPVAWTATDWWSDAPSAAVDAIEGFWIMRPWTSSERCPATRSAASSIGADPVTLPGQTLALGQIFYAEGARTGQRSGQAYESVLRMAPEDFDAAGGFQFRISGRIAATRSGGPVHCRQAAGSEQRPVCLIAVDIEEVAIEHPVIGKTLAVWTVAQGDAAER